MLWVNGLVAMALVIVTMLSERVEVPAHVSLVVFTALLAAVWVFKIAEDRPTLGTAIAALGILALAWPWIAIVLKATARKNRNSRSRGRSD